MSSKSKDIVTVDLEAVEITSESPMAGSVPKLSKSPVSTESQVGSLALTKFSPPADKGLVTPKWLETSIERKWSMVPLSMPIDDLVSKCLGRTSKVKKDRTESRIKYEKNLGH